jgi:hypothetical protein
MSAIQPKRADERQQPDVDCSFSMRKEQYVGTYPHEPSSTGRYLPHTKTGPVLQIIMLSALLWSLSSQGALFDFDCSPTLSQLQPHILATASTPPAKARRLSVLDEGASLTLDRMAAASSAGLDSVGSSNKQQDHKCQCETTCKA